MSLTETAAERLLYRRAIVPAAPGLVGARIGLAGATRLANGRHRLRHGHLDVRAGHATLSVPPSPGVDIAIRRAAEDLSQACHLTRGRDNDPDAGPGRSGCATTGVRVTLEAGCAGSGPLGYRYRWLLAHALVPVLRAVFGAPAAAVVPPPPGPDPRTSWATSVLDATMPDGRTFRAWTRAPAGRPGSADLDAHLEALALPIRARGHLELDVAGNLPAGAWVAPLAVTAVLLDDPPAAAHAADATWLLARPGGESPWTRAARPGLTDPELAAAARACLFTAYDALARHGAARQVRDAVAAAAEGDVLNRRLAHRRR